MKATLSELEGCFAIELEAETMEEAATIARFDMIRRARPRMVGVSVGCRGTFQLHAVFGKVKNWSGYIKPTRGG